MYEVLRKYLKFIVDYGVSHAELNGLLNFKNIDA